MRLLLSLILTVTVLGLPLAASQSTLEGRAAPECAIDCKQQVLADSSTQCSTTDITCLCADEQYQGALANCALANCTTRESLTAKYLSARECDLPIVQRYSKVDAGTLVPFIIASILFTTRMVAKSMGLGGGWGADDYTIIVAYALAIVVFSLNISMIHYGFGKNMWDIVPLDDMTAGFKRFYAYILAYKALISLAKISVCLFLLRIFQARTFRYMTYSMIAVNSAIAIVWILVDSFHCIPVHLAWTGWANPQAGKCIDFIASTYVNGFVNIAVDVIMVSMPVYEVLKLKLSPRKKLGVAVMFGVGLILTAVGIVRVIVFSFNDSNTNPTYEMEPLNFLSVIECQVAIICACLPATRAIIVHCLPGMLGRPGKNTSSGGMYPSMVRSKGAAASPSKTAERDFISKKGSYSVDIGAGPQVNASDGFIKLADIDSGKDLRI